MSFLIFDTETTGFPVKGVPATHPSQARIVQLAWLLLDEQFNELESYNQLFKLSPETKIHPGAQAAHGKTWEDCNVRGVEPQEGILDFEKVYIPASLVIAHNLSFDRQLIEIEAECAMLTQGTFCHWPSFRHFCTMEAMTPICKLPARYRGTSYKWPKLQEAYQHCFQKEFDGAHDALSDVRATAQVFRWLVDNGHYKLPLCPQKAINLPEQLTTTT